MALGLADMSTLTLRVGTVACFPGQLLYSVYYTLLRSPEEAFKRRLIGVLKHPEPPPPPPPGTSLCQEAANEAAVNVFCGNLVYSRP